MEPRAACKNLLKTRHAMDININQAEVLPRSGIPIAAGLGDALAGGAAPALENLSLYGNPASAAAQQAVQDALMNRK